MKRSSRTGGWIKLVNDDRLIGYLKDEGYKYDFEDDKWYHQDDVSKSIFEREREKGGASPERLAGFRAALERSPRPGSIRAELESMRERVDDRIDKFRSLPDIDRELRDVDGVASDLFGVSKSKETKRDDAFPFVEDLIGEHLDKELRELKGDVIEHRDRISSVSRRDEFEEALDLLKERSRDTETVEKILQPTIKSADKRIDKFNFKRELARDYRPDELRDLGIDSVQIFAQEHGFDRTDPKDLDEVRGILRSKGAKLTGKRDRFGNEVFELGGRKRESDEGFSITPV